MTGSIGKLSLLVDTATITNPGFSQVKVVTPMGRIGLAIRVFFRVLLDAALAEQVRRLLAAEKPAEPAAGKQAAETSVKKQPAPRASGRSDALSLLAALQREGRFVDFIKEPLAAYSDAQVGAAVRDVHRDCSAVLERFFAVRPLVEGSEGVEVDVPAGFDAARFRLVGNVQGQPPYRGKLCHHGWQATRTELPDWTGGQASAAVLSPAEVELK
jgi:hypothetical protein